MGGWVNSKYLGVLVEEGEGGGWDERRSKGGGTGRRVGGERGEEEGGGVGCLGGLLLLRWGGWEGGCSFSSFGFFFFLGWERGVWVGG